MGSLSHATLQLRIVCLRFSESTNEFVKCLPIVVLNCQLNRVHQIEGFEHSGEQVRSWSVSPARLKMSRVADVDCDNTVEGLNILDCSLQQNSVIMILKLFALIKTLTALRERPLC